jgi:phospholipid/cholesterol/gamma-HCH transport system ATP-binding protein
MIGETKNAAGKEKKTLISLRGVKKAFGEQQVLRGIDLDIYEGEALAILGGSGSGKSVLISMLVGLLYPDEGEIVINGKRVTDFETEAQWDAIRLKIGFLFQGSALYDSMNVGGNIAFVLRHHSDIDEEEIRKMVAEKLSLVGLSGIESKMPAELSGGMQKRVGLARAIAMDPPIIIYDEPTTGLDPLSSEMISELILHLEKELNVTSVVVTHDLPCAFRVAHRICLLKDGKLVFTGTPEEVARKHNVDLDEFIAAGAIPMPTI